MSAAVYIRLPERIAATLDAVSALQDMSRAGYARAIILRALPIHSDIALPPSPRRRASVIPPEDIAAVGRLIGEVGRATGAAIQLAKSLRETGHPSHPETEAILRDLRTAQGDLVAVIDRLRRGIEQTS